MDSADPNDDSTVNITDGIYVLNFLFLGGPSPADPGPMVCGADPTQDALTSCAYSHCP
jgi:hypothetical protein